MNRFLLYVIVFTGGMTTMAVEMSASRLLGPYFGNSLFIWANLIGLILIYLTAGYYLGGRVADRWPQPRLLFTLTLFASVAIAIVPFIAKPIMSVAIRGIDQVNAGAFLGSFGVTVLLFAAPVTVLGMVAPFAIRLNITSIETSGNVSGGLYALSTVGSIIGTFLPVFLFIPWIGTRDTMLLFAGALAVISAAGLRRGYHVAAPILIFAALLIPPGEIKPTAGAIYEGESPYQYVQVIQKDGTRYLQLNEGWAVHSEYNPSQPLTGGYWDYFLVAPWFGSNRPPGEVLNIGSAAGTICKELLDVYPRAHVDAVELDPDVVAVGRKYFDMNEKNLTVYVGDGRPYIKTCRKSYDMIAIDAFRQPYIPFYLTTREFFQEVKDHLNPGGTVMINVGTVPGDSKLADAIAATMRDVYPSVYSFSAGEFNQLIVATKDPSRAGELAARKSAMPAPVASLTDAALAHLSAVQPGGTILTDDKAPVEWLTDQMIIHYATDQR
ncbi:MAG: fused MFS/spermidine synthase [Actinobacteria bacterium]|nr:fused MFS/spermidine synthase [Actinomycetota bacterium]